MGGSGAAEAVGEEAPPYRAEGPRLLDRVRTAIRTRHLSARTEEAYVFWIRRYILFHGKQHPAVLGPEAVTRFLSHLAIERRVSASTQNQALSALLFLHRRVLGVDLPWLDGLVRAKRSVHVPTVLSRSEVAAVLSELTGTRWLMVGAVTSRIMSSRKLGRPVGSGGMLVTCTNAEGEDRNEPVGTPS